MSQCVASEYFSGQGAVLLATRDGAGDLNGLREVGNVSALAIGIETTTFEHKESCSGARGIDLEVVQETNVSVNFTMESFDRENLGLALFGTNALTTGSTASDELVEMHHDLWVPLQNIQVSVVVIGDDATPTTTYVLDTDYNLDAEAGMVRALSTGAITDGQVIFADYTFADQDVVEAVTSSTPPERWMRFCGLNTVNSNNPVVVDLYRVSLQPLAELLLINDEISTLEVEAKVLVDTFRLTGSQFFTIKKIA